MDSEQILKKQTLDPQNQSLKYFTDDFYGDFYDFFINFLKFKQLTKQIKNLNETELVLYLDVQNKRTYSYKLVFDYQLNFISAKSEYTLTALVKEIKGLPDDLNDYQQVAKQVLAKLEQGFAAANEHDKIAQFNIVLGQIFKKYQLTKDNICYQLQ